jgi:hypothetical protein
VSCLPVCESTRVDIKHEKKLLKILLQSCAGLLWWQVLGAQARACTSSCHWHWSERLTSRSIKQNWSPNVSHKAVAWDRLPPSPSLLGIHWKTLRICQSSSLHWSVSPLLQSVKRPTCPASKFLLLITSAVQLACHLMSAEQVFTSF